jgi:hypothetical protein
MLRLPFARTFRIAILLGLGQAGCAGPPSPSTPSSNAATSSITVSGVVYDHTTTGPEPRAGVTLAVRDWRLGRVDSVTSDSKGRYEIPLNSGAVVSIAPSVQSVYRAPCPSGAEVLEKDAIVDVNIISTAVLATTGAPASWPRPRSYSVQAEGAVFERTATGLQPLSGAWVDLAGDDSDRYVMSSTLTDRLGRYLLCTAPPGVGTDQAMWIRVERDGYYPASVRIIGNSDVGDIELVRR